MFYNLDWGWNKKLIVFWVKDNMLLGCVLIFLIMFSVIVVLFGFGFYYRYKLIVNLVEKEERKKYNI